ncbi:PDZ domain-containing protein [Stieleria varia]|uniref:PDZ domain-containing protein n=1 Tax=Stieleria varia TaxID=2528005 RepID=A0A5C6BDD3_9BACT|nr:PDZ domain-containing protein [Stieleria varia]TWU08454.1 hypothetical protein Pla52n_10370 [Stieleria varia]
MKKQITRFSLAAMLLFGATTAIGQEPDAVQPPSRPAAVQQNAPWGISTRPIPQILRLHLPGIPPDCGIWIREVEPQSPAARLGLQPNDLLLEIDGLPIAAVLPPAAENSMVSVLRNGQPLLLTPRQNMRRWFPYTTHSPQRTIPQIPVPQISAWPAGGVGVSAYATGNQSFSVSRVGDQISIEMSDPDASPEPIRFAGTPQEILHQLDACALSIDAKQKVRQAIGQ